MLSIQDDNFTPAAVSLKPLLSAENFLHLETSECFFQKNLGREILRIALAEVGDIS